MAFFPGPLLPPKVLLVQVFFVHRTTQQCLSGIVHTGKLCTLLCYGPSFMHCALICNLKFHITLQRLRSLFTARSKLSIQLCAVGMLGREGVRVRACMRLE